MRAITAIFILAFSPISFTYAQDGAIRTTESELIKEAKSDLRNAPTSPLPMTEDESMKFRRYSPWGFSYFNWSTQNMYQTRTGIASYSSYNYLGAEYRLSYLSKISVRQTFFVNGAGPYSFCKKQEDFGTCAPREGGTEVGDMYVQYFRNQIALLPGNIGLVGWFRAYLPMGKSSRDNHQITELATKLIFTKPLSGRVEGNYVFEPHYAFLTKRGHENEFDSKVNANKFAEIRHYFEVAERVSETLGFAQQIGFHHEWFYPLDYTSNGGERVTEPMDVKDSVELKVSALFNVAGVRFTAGLNNEIPIDGNNLPNKRAARIFREDETEYSLMTFVNF